MPQNILHQALELYREEGLQQLVHAAKRYIRYRDPLVIPVWKRLLAVYRHTKYQVQYGAAAPKPYELLRIEPTRIEKWIDPKVRSEIRFSPFGSQIAGGDWDQTAQNDQPTLDRYRAMERSIQQRFVEGYEWEDTDIYEHIRETRDDMMYDSYPIDERLDNIDKIYKDLKQDGYKTQRELGEGNDHPGHRRGAPPEIHEVGVALTRDGDFSWFFAGHHRLMLAQFIGLDAIPVRVVVRHEFWQDIRSEVTRAESKDELSERARSHLDHPDIYRLTTFDEAA